MKLKLDTLVELQRGKFGMVNITHRGRGNCMKMKR